MLLDLRRTFHCSGRPRRPVYSKPPSLLTQLGVRVNLHVIHILKVFRLWYLYRNPLRSISLPTLTFLRLASKCKPPARLTHSLSIGRTHFFWSVHLQKRIRSFASRMKNTDLPYETRIQDQLYSNMEMVFSSRPRLSSKSDGVWNNVYYLTGRRMEGTISVGNTRINERVGMDKEPSVWPWCWWGGGRLRVLLIGSDTRRLYCIDYDRHNRRIGFANECCGIHSYGLDRSRMESAFCIGFRMCRSFLVHCESI